MIVKAVYRHGPLTAALRRLNGSLQVDAIVRSFAWDVHRTTGQIGPPFDPFRFAEALGVPVEWDSIETDGVLAKWPSGDCRIVLKTRRPMASRSVRRRERFTLAHELGHFMIRRHVAGFMPASHFKSEDPEEERLCDVFAAALLMPGHMIFSDLKQRGVAPAALLALAEQYDVSLQSILCRAGRAAKGHLMAVIWVTRGQRLSAEWASPGRYREVVLCDTGATSVERSTRSDLEQHGRDEYLLGGKRTRWECVSLRLPPSKVLTVGLRAGAPLSFKSEKGPAIEAVGPRVALQYSLPFEDPEAAQGFKEEAPMVVAARRGPRRRMQ